jgi:hypothetical protein
VSGDASSHHNDTKVNDGSNATDAHEDIDARENAEGPIVPPGMIKNNGGEEEDKRDTDASGDASSL